MAASEEMAARVASAAAWRSTSRPAALAARPVLPEPAALVAALLTDLAALAALAATVGRLMAGTRLVAMAVRALTAARRSEDLAAPEEMAAMVASAAPWRSTSRPEALAAGPAIAERAALVAAL